MDVGQVMSHAGLVLADAGLETDLVFNRGIELPHFSSVVLLQREDGRAALERYYRDFLELARDEGCPLVLESATWRASSDWAEPLGLSLEELATLNNRAVVLLRDLATEFEGMLPGVVVSGCIGPRGDGYDPGQVMRREEAASYHARQGKVLRDAGADVLSAITMTNSAEAAGIACMARSIGVEVVISFTVETDGALPTGQSLAEAIADVEVASEGHPAYYMINCAHPTHFRHVLDGNAPWMGRIGGLRANASRCSHAELDAMTELDTGNVLELAGQYRELQQTFPGMRVLGGCCGTDLSHVAAIARACRG